MIFFLLPLVVLLCPLIVQFRTWEDPSIGGPLHMGAPLNQNNPDSSVLNLHTPGLAAGLIRHGRQRGGILSRVRGLSFLRTDCNSSLKWATRWNKAIHRDKFVTGLSIGCLLK